MVIKEIVEQFIKVNKYDGLYNENSRCACDLEDFMPCLTDTHPPGQKVSIADCMPGMKTACNCVQHRFHIGRGMAYIRNDSSYLTKVVLSKGVV